MLTLDDETKMIADLVTEEPERAKVFERYGIDFCCGGKRTLAQVCKEKNLPLEELVKELDRCRSDQAGEEPDWMLATLSELADHIEAVHHAYLNEELPRLSLLAKKVAAVHGEKHPELIELNLVFHGLKAEMEQHSMKEEQILFPMCRQLDSLKTKPSFHCGSISNPISVMEAEHDNAGAALARMRDLTKDYTLPVDACTSY
ncbi:MAG: iron-sulfur cluster repair di-iron protein, partial [Candidatus Obscuribacterales bacterium]|nr:iron-sulfur cluster repair di-iron protein [Candidatus Obscuribacterales bacterium]